MKGIVFIVLNEMIEAAHGIDVWEAILAEVQPSSGGIYVATENYADEEMVAYVKAISTRLNQPTTAVTKLFGRYLFDELNTRYSVFTENHCDLFDFLDSVENVIHKEVRKLYPNANLPSLGCEKISDSEMIFHYRSPRKLCFLSEGLIQGAADYYQDRIQLSHPVCMHDGADHCELRIQRER